MGKRDNRLQRAEFRAAEFVAQKVQAAEFAPMELVMSEHENAMPSYADMLREIPRATVSVRTLPPPRRLPVANLGERHRANSLMDYAMEESQHSFSEPKRDLDYWIRVLRHTAVPKSR